VDHETLNLIKIFLTSTFFTFKGTCYEQTEVTTMGSSLSPMVSYIFMDHFETLSLKKFNLKPKCWFIFIDDTLVVWPHGHSSLTSFFYHLNNNNPHIQFTMEMEKDNSLPFLDVLISHIPNGSLTHQFYLKNTDTNRYLHAQSHHHPAQKFVVLKTIVSRAIRISNPQFLEKEKYHLTKVLMSNCYTISQYQQGLPINPQA
jgi:hypothetical protein